jgi:hypothetical protein
MEVSLSQLRGAYHICAIVHRFSTRPAPEWRADAVWKPHRAVFKPRARAKARLS